MPKTDIWEFQALLTRRLLWWSGASIALGLVLLFLPAFWRGLGIQFLAWGLIDAAIAGFGARASRKRRAGLPSRGAARTQAAASEIRSLRSILAVNTGLDVLYVAGGAALWIFMGADPLWRGHALGVLVQGGFLFGFDLFHVLAIQPLSTGR